MGNTITTLLDFITAAERSRKYPPSTASNHRSPLRLIQPELTEEENNSLEIFKSHLDQVFDIIYSKNKSEMSASSIEVYKKRVRSLIADYEKYGTEPSKMASWNRQIITRKHNKVKQEILPTVAGQTEDISHQFPEITTTNKHQFSFGAFISTPFPLTKKQHKEIESYVGYLGTTVVDDKLEGEPNVSNKEG